MSEIPLPSPPRASLRRPWRHLAWLILLVMAIAVVLGLIERHALAAASDRPPASDVRPFVGGPPIAAEMRASR